MKEDDYTLSLYIKRPSGFYNKEENAQKQDDDDLLFGHAFVGITKPDLGYEIFYHYYPKKPVTSLVSPFVKSAHKRDTKRRPYDEKIEYKITEKQKNQIDKHFEKIKNKKYSILAFNCVHFSKELIEATGLSSPKFNYSPAPISISKKIRKMEENYENKKSELKKTQNKLGKSFYKNKKPPFLNSSKKSTIEQQGKPISLLKRLKNEPYK